MTQNMAGSDTGLTASDLHTMGLGNADFNLKRRLRDARTYAQKRIVVEDGVKWATLQLVKNRRDYQGTGEDNRTGGIVIGLNGLGFNATRDEKNGGHADITIPLADNFLWQAEAKNWDGPKWALGGLMQLLTRYSSGMPEHNGGGILLYFDLPEVEKLMTKWRDVVAKERSTESMDDFAPMEFRSTHQHPTTGLPYVVRHYPVALLWKPQTR